MKMQSMKKVVLRRKTRLALAAAAILLIAGACYGAYKAATPGGISENTVLYSYSVSADSSYAVRLIENELYPEGVLGEDGLYARNLIDTVNITFSADYSGSKDASISGHYSIVAAVQGYQSSGENRKIIYTRAFPLLENKSFQGQGNVNISETVPLDIEPYYAFAEKAEQILGAKPGRQASVVFEGVFVAQSEFGEIQEPFSCHILIPLSNELFSITKGNPLAKTDAITETIETVAEDITVSAAIVVPVAGIALGLLAILALIFFTRLPTAAEQYALDFKTLSRKHGSRMAKLSALPLISAVLQVDVADFESLVKIADERQHSICYFPDENGLPVNGLLFVPDGEICYQLRLKSAILL